MAEQAAAPLWPVIPPKYQDLSDDDDDDTSSSSDKSQSEEQDWDAIIQAGESRSIPSPQTRRANPIVPPRQPSPKTKSPRCTRS